MNLMLAVILSATLATLSFGEDPTNMQPKKKMEKNIKTNGKISTSGCETAKGKTLSENDFGHADCVKQIGLKKKK